MAYRLQIVPRRKRRIMHTGERMRAPYGLEIIESCLTCPLREDRLFCDLPPGALKGLEAISSSATYPKGAILFVEGQEPRGVFVLCNGRVKLSTSSADGKSLILRIAEPGEIIGLPGTMSNRVYEATAEALEPLQANFISREAFLQFLCEHGEAAVRVAQILSEICHATYQEVRYLGLSGSAAEKFARFLLDWASRQPQNKGDVRGTFTLTHEEIAQMIGASRETVTRLFADFKRKGLLEVHGSTLVICNKASLQKLIEV
ncbi:MAG TPA: Crp/Fnr family transcriptional regulator [Candidatus Acidoferrales bacterium]|nr:Crp/Fnr family transcriptional regulator [Candidatus Acidoferrales bacterium]